MTTPTDGDICFTLSVVDETQLAVDCCERINRVYPYARIVLLVDQADRSNADVFALLFAGGRFNTQVVPFPTRLYSVENTGLVVSEHLRMFLRTRAKWWFKIDPDTRVNRPFRDLPDGACFFGTLQSGLPRDSLQGGCLGGTRAAAETVFRSGLLASAALADHELSWAGNNPHLRMRIADQGVVSFDFIHAWVCEQLDIPLRNHPEIQSNWLAPPEHASAYAVSHPDGPRYNTPASELIHQTVRRIVPARGRLAVMGTRGAPREVEACSASAFVSNEGPSESDLTTGDSAPLIAYTKECEDLGANFLVIPQYAYGWYLHVTDFWQYLEEHYPRVWRDKTCLIYQLGPPTPLDSTGVGMDAGQPARRNAPGRHGRRASSLRRTRAVAQRVLPHAANVVMVQHLANGRATLVDSLDATGSTSRRQDTVTASSDPRDVDALLILRRYHFLAWLRTEGHARFESLRWHLESCYPRVWNDRHAIIYRLGPPVGTSSPRRRSAPANRRLAPAAATVQFDRIRQVIDLFLPVRHRIAVISKGDDVLMEAVGGNAMHFPQTDTGVYAGYHPGDSDEASAQLDIAIGRGATHLLMPNTAFWWLDHYADFVRRLNADGGCVWHDKYCAIFRLVPHPGQPTRSVRGGRGR